MIYRARIALLLTLAVACAGTPDSPAPGRARVFGTLRLVPHEGAPPAAAGGGSYGSRRMRDTVLVDYSTPGFAVVYVAEDAQPGGTVQVSVRDTLVEPRFEPANLAIGVGGKILLENTSKTSHIVSYPAARLVKRLEPGGRLEIPVPQAGEQGLFLLDVRDAAATLFVAPGRYAVVSTSGAFALEDLAPGELEVRAWHPRFPPVARRVQLAPDASQRVDFEMGVGIGPDGAPETVAR
jgi:plastocyanin